jgi:hypothetical protein
MLGSLARRDGMSLSPQYLTGLVRRDGVNSSTFLPSLSSPSTQGLGTIQTFHFTNTN